MIQILVFMLYPLCVDVRDYAGKIDSLKIQSGAISGQLSKSEHWVRSTSGLFCGDLPPENVYTTVSVCVKSGESEINLCSAPTAEVKQVFPKALLGYDAAPLATNP